MVSISVNVMWKYTNQKIACTFYQHHKITLKTLMMAPCIEQKCTILLWPTDGLISLLKYLVRNVSGGNAKSWICQNKAQVKCWHCANFICPWMTQFLFTITAYDNNRRAKQCICISLGNMFLVTWSTLLLLILCLSVRVMVLWVRVY
jgi:hypothetical protein